MTAMHVLLRAAAMLFLGTAWVSRTARANVWYVTPDGSGDAATIQDAIDAASAGDSVVLAPGTYTWTAQGGDHVGLPGPSMLNMRSGVTLKSAAGPAVTILDAEGNGRVVRCQSTSNVRIEGLTIQGGNAEAEGLPGPFSMGTGGGILCKYGSSIVIANNLLCNNRSKSNGTLTMLLSDSEILENVVCWNTGQYGFGGIYVSGGTAMVRGNTVASNAGGGVGFDQTTATFTENLLLNTTSGSGLWCGGPNVAIMCNNVWGNSDGNVTTCSLGGGNISQDPLVCITSSEFHVQRGSPCLPENNGCGVLMGARGVGCTTTDVSEGRLPRAALWVTASPNPFNPQTTITYALHPTAEHVRVTIYDLHGRRVSQVVDDHASGTSSSVLWNGSDEMGLPVAAGVYIARLDLGPEVTTTKLVLVK